MRTLVFFLLAMSVATTALAEQRPHPLDGDKRIRGFEYVEGDVYRVDAHFGYVTTLILHPHERIRSIQIGDSASWFVERLASENMVAVKPLERRGHTNMTVTTDAGRMYTFALYPRRAAGPADRKQAFRIHFRYPHEEAQARAAAEREARLKEERLAALKVRATNATYTYAGAESLRPFRAFDDGTRTYFAFPSGFAQPAIFLVNADGSERVVEHHREGDLIVVHTVGRQFVLRDGEAFTCIFNRGWTGPEFDAASPQPDREVSVVWDAGDGDASGADRWEDR